MIPQYADPNLKTATAHPWLRAILAILLLATLGIGITLSIRAIRWDRWANYENNHRPWYDGLGGESYASFKAWRASRASWDRSLAAAVVAAVAITLSAAVILLRRIRISIWLIVLILGHGLPIAYFIWRWGPDFRHPQPVWGG